MSWLEQKGICGANHFKMGIYIEVSCHYLFYPVLLFLLNPLLYKVITLFPVIYLDKPLLFNVVPKSLAHNVHSLCTVIYSKRCEVKN